ncbi:glucokinase [Chitinophaga sp. YR627]|uniref:ROK family protein n=1 Tax=Chitinophaga sp. YR627 TaxID=1881041 RepID=UPI0008E55E87|nr:ROK family protein [Chitinophaga sp. YR627]SFN24461.1 glucokinase [Chitinophaga sp. YR627]
MDGLVLAVDIGGSHITTALVDMQQRTLLPRSLWRANINSHGSAEEIIAGWVDVMQQSMGNTNGANRIGIAMPGPFDYEAGISLIKGLHKYESLYGLNIKELLAKRLQISPDAIRFTNDASCFLQGELFAGVAEGAQSALGLTLGTGFGSSVAENGMAQEGTFWKTPFRETTAEEYFSTRWFLRRYEVLSGAQISSVKELALMAHEPGYAKDIFEEFGHNLAAFLQEQQPLPSLIVLGGNIAQAFHLFFRGLEEQLPDVQFVVSTLGEDAILLGAAGAWTTIRN